MVLGIRAGERPLLRHQHFFSTFPVLHLVAHGLGAVGALASVRSVRSCFWGGSERLTQPWAMV